MSVVEIPLKPFKAGKIASEFGGPAESPLEVLERTRITLSPRGSWSSNNYTATTHEGHARCVRQCFTDVDGVHAVKAAEIFLRAVKEVTGKKYTSIPSFNDNEKTHKHHVIMALDRAIEIASG